MLSNERMNFDIQQHLIRSVSVRTWAAIICSLMLSGTIVSAQEIMKTCGGVEVRSINISAETEREVLLEAAPEKPAIEIAPAPPSSPMSDTVGKAVTIIALGPVLGSMDLRTVETDLACTAKGFALTATITRSADFHGGVLKNVIWRPKIEIAVVLRQPEVIFEATWRMRLTTGAEAEHTQTPPYPEQKYPATVTKTVR